MVVLVAKLCPTLCNLINCSLPAPLSLGFPRLELEWVVTSFSRGSSQPTHVSITPSNFPPIQAATEHCNTLALQKYFCSHFFPWGGFSLAREKMQTKNMQTNLCREVWQARRWERGRELHLWEKSRVWRCAGKSSRTCSLVVNNVSWLLPSSFKLGACSLSLVPFSLILHYGQSYFLILLFVSSPVVPDNHVSALSLIAWVLMSVYLFVYLSSHLFCPQEVTRQLVLVECWWLLQVRPRAWRWA